MMYLVTPLSLSSIIMLQMTNQLNHTINLIIEMWRIIVVLLLNSLEQGKKMINIQNRTYLNKMIRKRIQK